MLHSSPGKEAGQHNDAVCKIYGLADEDASAQS